MSDPRIDDLDKRVREAEKVIFNGVRDTSAKMAKWLDEKAPHLMTREEHEKIDDAHAKKIADANRDIGKKKDRRLVAIGLAIPVVTIGFTKLLELL